MVITFGCCVSSWEKFDRNVAPIAGERPVITLTGQTSIARAYNTILSTDAAATADAVVLLHDDLQITDPEWEVKVQAAVEDPDVALAGVAGGRGVSSLAWWAAEAVGHQTTDAGLLDFGPRTGDVQSLEGSILILSRWAVRNLRFDEEYEGFHGYDEVSFQALAAGKRVVVIDLDTHHHTAMGFRSEPSARQWADANARFVGKWRHLLEGAPA